jgi:hypothetical protein
MVVAVISQWLIYWCIECFTLPFVYVLRIYNEIIGFDHEEEL